ncbi:CbrC family protein [Chitinilyticum piscinae]|uniref:CbrC family protein n=1 Tax=Chitinilyticum piscinae TaxID=2866724 RepID=A0A8J7K869_9NEIS|nr:CbrC family protein [Chitinilyticum piscinae]MBE9609088.1 CbrC family protein [Chitinilyticum piscinae]
MSELPVFRYHPDPLTTGALVPSEQACRCCGLARGLMYALAPYSTHAGLAGALCPWCIADGAAETMFAASFVDDYPLLQAGLPLDVVNEVCGRTPGYASWQQEVWQAHCGDACAFHGEAGLADVAAASAASIALFEQDYPFWQEGWADLAVRYQPGGAVALYRFVCLHCGVTRFGLDLA